MIQLEPQMPGQHAPDEQPEDRRRQGREQEIGAEAEDRQQQKRPPPEPVRQVARQRREQELCQAEGREHHAADHRRAVQRHAADLFDQRRRDRDDQAKAHHVQEHGDQHEGHGMARGRRRARRGSGGCGCGHGGGP
jgi:hypothetical protein